MFKKFNRFISKVLQGLFVESSGVSGAFADSILYGFKSVLWVEFTLLIVFYFNYHFTGQIEATDATRNIFYIGLIASSLLVWRIHVYLSKIMLLDIKKKSYFSTFKSWVIFISIIIFMISPMFIMTFVFTT